ncbi:hypothetical protein SpCBS45565_g00791 [Spizellomyces sp. 'palustris']|nr:hypothetical protein SpCBS45565_g00791 [Spizellomyces sp. 'palustris']
MTFPLRTIPRLPRAFPRSHFQPARLYYTTSRLLSSSNTSPDPSPLQTYNIFESPSPSTKTFKSVGNTSFTVGDVRLQGPVVLINDTVFMWDVPQFGAGSEEVEITDTIIDGETLIRQGAGSEGKQIVDDPSSPFHGWTTDNFKLFEVTQPVPELLVVGTGAQTYILPPFLRSYLHKLGLQLEVMASRQAASTYNILLQEGRRPAAALLPVIPTSSRTGEMLVKFSKPEFEKQREREAREHHRAWGLPGNLKGNTS